MPDDPLTPAEKEQAILEKAAEKGQALLEKAAQAKRDEAELIESVMARPTRRSESIAKLAMALSQVQGAMQAASRDSANPFFKSKYASLASTWEACREALSKHELAILQPVTTRGKSCVITTLLVHSSGEWIEERLVMTSAQDTPQGLGSTITYGRRYGLQAMVGIAAADDDGQEGSGTQPPQGVRVDPGRRSPLQAPEKGAVSDELPDLPVEQAPPANQPAPAAAAAPIARPVPRPSPSTVRGVIPPPPGMKAPARLPGEKE